jgi:hypothetical protein
VYVTHVVIISKLYFGRYTILLHILQMYYNSCSYYWHDNGSRTFILLGCNKI